MATSGSYDFSVSRDDLIKDALLELGVLESGEAPTADEATDCARRLNMLVKSLMTKPGYHLWTVQDAVLFQVLGQQSYALGDSASDTNWCAWDDYAQTTLSSAALSGASSVALTSATGFTTGDKIGVVLDSGAIQWTTATMSGTTATLGANLTGAAASGNAVFGYTSRLVRPLRLIEGTIYRRDISSNDTPIELIAKPEYDQLSAKTQRGKTVQVAYQPFLGSGRIWTWLTADLSTDVIRFSYERPIQDFDATGDTPDLPIEWSKALYLNLAVDVAGMFGASDELPRVKALAEEALDDMYGWGQENAPVKFQPDLR